MTDKKRVLVIIGTRPEAIKMAPVHAALIARPDVFETLCCVSAQHRDMLDDVLRVFDIVPQHDLDVMRGGQTLAQVHSTVLAGTSEVMEVARPDLVLVHGDTTTALAGAYAAFYAGIPVGHVEAGLRSGRLDAPFPEEANRRTIAMMARWHFAPTDDSRANLLAEGHNADSIVVTGNTVVDAVALAHSRLEQRPDRLRAIETELTRHLGSRWQETKTVLVTCHRRETMGLGHSAIFAAIGDLAAAFPDVRFVYLLHPNPKVAGPAKDALSRHDGVRLLPPVSYDQFLHLLRHCHLVLSDSGGLQEEGAAFGIPVLLLRETTERPEAVRAGGVRIVGTTRSTIVDEATALLTDQARHRGMAEAPNPFGDGRAAERIAGFLQAQSL